MRGVPISAQGQVVRMGAEDRRGGRRAVEQRTLSVRGRELLEERVRWRASRCESIGSITHRYRAVRVYVSRRPGNRHLTFLLDFVHKRSTTTREIILLLATGLMERVTNNLTQ